MSTSVQVDRRYYQVARPGSVAEKLMIMARDNIYQDFLKQAHPDPASSILDVGVSDVVGESANVLERKYPHLDRVTAVGLGAAVEFRSMFPQIRYRQISPGQPLPFADDQFDVATSNAVLEHVGGAPAQVAFVSELERVARRVFLSVPNCFFPIEHHTGLPFLHWSDAAFRFGCALLNKKEWADPAQLILMSRARLNQLRPTGQPARIGATGIRLGVLSSNLFMYFERRDEK